MKDKYKFRIKDGAGQYYYVDTTLGVATSPSPQDIQSIASWSKMQLLWERDNLYRGVFRKYAPDQFLYVLEAAKILRYIFNTQGNGEAVAYLEVMMLKNADLLYYPLGTFQFNFSKHVSEELYVKELMMEGGLTQKMNAFDTTDFAIKLLEPTLYPEISYMLMDGVMLQGKYNYRMLRGSLGLPGGSSLTIPMVFVDQEGKSPFGIPNSGIVPATTWPGGDFDSGYHFKVMEPYQARINFEFGYTIASISPDVTALEVWVQIRGKKPTVTILDDIHVGDIDLSGGPGSSGMFQVSTPWRDYSIANMENYLFFYFKCFSSSGSGMQLEFDEYSKGANIEYKHTLSQTVVRTISQWELFKKLVGKISGNEADPPAASSLLTTDVYPNDAVWNLNPVHTYFTCGDALRGLPTPEGIGIGDDEVEIKTNFKDFTWDAFTRQCAGIGIEMIDGEEKIVLEHLSYFFRDDVVIADFGTNIKDFNITLYEKYRGNSIKNGYKSNTYDEVNGRYEFNAEFSYKAPVIQSIQDLDFVSPYRADCYGIEYTRMNMEGKKTTDSSSDNDTFIIQSNGNEVDVPGYYPYPKMLERAHTITEGIPAEIAETVFNVPMQPRRSMNRMMPFIESNFYGIPDSLIAYQTKRKNAIAASMYGGAVVAERSDITLTGEGLLWKPYVFSITTYSRIELNEVMTSNQKYGKIKFKVKRGEQEAELAGFVLKAGINPATKEEYEYELLCSPTVEIPSWL